MRVNFYFSALSFKQSFLLIFGALKSLVRISSHTKAYHRTEFETHFTRKFFLDSAIAMPSNRSGIYSILKGLKIEPDDEVIVTGYTCAAVVEPILLLGATPVFVDINCRNLSMSIEDIDGKINEKTKVIIIQHSFGFVAPVKEVINKVRERGIFVIEDCALALGSTHAKYPLGTMGDAAIWSFELSKTISVGWGGLISVRNNYKLAEKIVEIRNSYGYFGRLSLARRLFQGGMSGIFYHHAVPLLMTKYVIGPFVKLGIFKCSADTRASNVKMPSDFQWKILLQQLGRLEQINEFSRHVTNEYNKVLATLGCPIFWESAYGESTVLIRYPILVPNPERFLAYFAKMNIEIGRWFSSPVSGADMLRGLHYVQGICPKAEWVGMHIINLPLNARLENHLVTLITEGLKSYFETNPEELEWMRQVHIQLEKLE